LKDTKEDKNEPQMLCFVLARHIQHFHFSFQRYLWHELPFGSRYKDKNGHLILGSNFVWLQWLLLPAHQL